MHEFFYGRINRRGGVKIKEGGVCHIQVSTSRHPLGSDIEAPDGIGSTTIDHTDEPIGVKMVAWHATGEVGDGVEVHHVDSFAEGVPDPQSRAREIGDAEVIAETAVRKKGDGEGSVTTEYRMTLRMAFDADRPLSSQPVGHFLANKTFALALTPAQVSLPAMPPKRKPGRPAKNTQMSLVEDKVPDDADDAIAVDKTVIHVDYPQRSMVVTKVSASSATCQWFEDGARVNQDFDPELLRTAPAQPSAADNLLAAIQGIEAEPESPSTPAELREPESMIEKATKAKRKGKGKLALV